MNLTKITRFQNATAGMLNCPHNEMKLKQNSFKTVDLKQFWKCFVSFSFRCEDSFRATSCFAVIMLSIASESGISPSPRTTPRRRHDFAHAGHASFFFSVTSWFKSNPLSSYWLRRMSIILITVDTADERNFEQSMLYSDTAHCLAFDHSLILNAQ